MANTIMSAKNSFELGLLMDFAPEVTPPNCMTSALNATLLTFNGNEMSLQNDMGNGRVETAFLPDGYVPVGTCEFGDIIYIVSYNPIINKSLIGCFPSPERNISSDEIGNMKQTLSWKDFLKSDDGINPNGELKTSSVKKILYDSKDMTPGDKYIIYSTELKNADNNKYLSDYGNSTHEHGTFPKLAKIHVVSIEESGKIVYLDSTTKWYDNYHYYLNANPEFNADGKLDIDSYRTMVSSAYSIFSSKVSGKLALLVELEKITGFSCSWEPYISDSDNTIEDGTKFTDYSIYWNFNWTTNDNNINPSGVVLTLSEWTGVDLDKAGKYLEWKSGDSYELNLVGEDWKDISCPDSYESSISRNYMPEEHTALDYNTFLSTYEYSGYLLRTINEIKIGGVEPYKLNIDKTGGKPVISNYYVNCTNITKEGPKTTNSTGDLVDAWSGTLNDDIVNNYFHYPVVKSFANFSIPTKLVFEGGKVVKTPYINNLIYHYKIAPAMPYGILEEYTQEGYIDFSKIGTKSIELKTWKYYNYENTSTLTWGMEAYTEPGKGISEVVFEFYDNQGFVAAYHNKGKNSYNGTFTEYITLNESGSNYKLNNIPANPELDEKGLPKPKYHKGLEVSGNNVVKGVVYLNGDSTKATDITPEGTYYQDDSGTLYPNFLYLVKIIIKYCNKGILDDYVENESNYITDYRWFWTNTMFNEYYYNTQDFKDLLFTLNLDCNAVYGYNNTSNISNAILYQGIPNSEVTLINNTEYTQLKANVTCINQGDNTPADKEGNILSKILSGLVNDYNTFNLDAGSLENIDVSVYLGRATIKPSTELPNVISTEDLGYVFPGIYPTLEQEEKMNESDYIAKIGNKLGKLLHDLLGSIKNPSNEEINSTETSYQDYVNTFSLTFAGEETAQDPVEIEYIESSGEVTTKNLPYITKKLSDVEYNFGESQINFTFTGIIYSKFYELKQLLTADFKIVKPLLYDNADLERYNMDFNNRHFYFKLFGGIAVGDDADHKTRDRMYLYTQDADINDNGKINTLGDYIHEHEFGTTGPSFWSSEVQHFDSKSLTNVYPGITPFIIARKANYGKQYRITKGVNDSSAAKAKETTEYSKYFINNITYINNNPNQSTGIKPDLSNVSLYNTYAVLALKDKEDQVHLLNTFIPLLNSKSTNGGYINLVINYKSDAYNLDLYRPSTIGDAVASLLMNLYYSDGTTKTDNYLGTSNFIYLDKHNYLMTKDIVYKLEIRNTDETNSMIRILGMAYLKYLEEVCGLGSPKLKDPNVKVIINPIQKTCPLQFLFDYITPIQLASTNPNQIIKCSDGSEIFSDIGFSNGSLYMQNISNPLQFDRLDGSYFLYYPYNNFEYSTKSLYIGVKHNLLVSNNYIKNSFELQNDQLVCKTPNPNVGSKNNSITINGTEDDDKWCGIYPILKSECLLTMGELI